MLMQNTNDFDLHENLHSLMAFDDERPLLLLLVSFDLALNRKNR